MVALPPAGLGGDWAGGGETAGRAAAAGSDDASTREYRHGDDLRKVHWRSTARVGELMVRREEQPHQSRATLLLDTRSRAHRGEGDGVLLRVGRRGRRGRGRVAAAGRLRRPPACSTTPGRCVPPGLPLTEALLLDLLADVAARSRARPRAGRRAAAPRGRRRARRGPRPLPARTTLEGLARLRSGPVAGTALLLDTPSWAGPAAHRTAPGAAGTPADPPTSLLATGWRVAHVRSGAALPEVWAQVAGRRGAGARPSPAAAAPSGARA